MTTMSEPEWDDTERDLMLGLELYEEDLCGGCGLPTSVRTDPVNNVFRIVHDHCPVCSQLARFGRAQADDDRKATEANKKTPSKALPADGRTTHLRRVDPAQAAPASAAESSENGP